MPTVRKNWEKPNHDAVNVKAQWGFSSRHGVQHPASWVVRILLVASNGVEWWIQVVQSETEIDDMRGE